MKRWADRIAAAAVLALAGYAVRQLVRDVQAMRYVDRIFVPQVTIERRGDHTAYQAWTIPARVLTWDEAIAQHDARLAAAGVLPRPVVEDLGECPPKTGPIDPDCCKACRQSIFRVPAIDPDIIEHVHEMRPKSRAQRVALEQTLQNRRDRGW